MPVTSIGISLQKKMTEVDTLALDRKTAPSVVVKILREHPEKIKDTILGCRISDLARVCVVQELWTLHKEVFQECLKPLIHEAYNPIISVLDRLSLITEDLCKKDLLRVDAHYDATYLHSLEIYSPRISGFSAWAHENDLVKKCLEHIHDGSNSVLYILHKYQVPLKGRDLTFTAKFLLLHEYHRLVEEAILIGKERGLNYDLVKLASRLSPEFVLTSFIDKYRNDSNPVPNIIGQYGDWIKAMDEEYFETFAS